jgi:hypothetical protein
MRRLFVCVTTVALACLAVLPTPSSAQRVLGVGDDALVLPRGVFRFRTLGQWTWFNERYGKDTPGRPDGALEPLGIDFTLDTIGVKQFPNLAALQVGIQGLTGNPNWYATLGNTVVNLRDHVDAFPFVFEAGLSKRFSVGIQIPYVHTQTSAFFNVGHEWQPRIQPWSRRRSRHDAEHDDVHTVHNSSGHAGRLARGVSGEPSGVTILPYAAREPGGGAGANRKLQGVRGWRGWASRWSIQLTWWRLHHITVRADRRN